MRAALCAGRRLSFCHIIAASGCGQSAKRAALNVEDSPLVSLLAHAWGECYCCCRMMTLIPVTSLTS